MRSHAPSVESPRLAGRAGQLARLSEGVFDALVLGGGISGVATAHELTARGYRVALIDSRDFASGTSQESSQLIWGGIKYLENGHVGVVRELCVERNKLCVAYPSRIAPMRFLYPRLDHDAHMLTALTMGAWLYHVLGRGFHQSPTRLDARQIAEIVPLIRTEGFRGGFEYSDARMIDSDARLTLDILFDAMDAGLTACNYLELTDPGETDASGARRLTFTDAAPGADGKIGATSGASVMARARWVINACGVWVDGVNERFGVRPPHRHVFSKGIHITIPPVETGGRALTLLDRERRPFFVIPWGAATLVGTTDTPFTEPPRRVTAEPEEIDFLRREVEARFKLKIDDAMILGTKAGLRPLVAPAKVTGREDFLALARGHEIWSDRRAALTSVWGGKYTSCFAMAREIADTVAVRPSGAARGIEPTFPAERLNDAVMDLMDKMDGMDTMDHLRRACRIEMVVTMDDLLRRRTNLALKVANQGRGANHENAAALARLESEVLRANHSHRAATS